MKELVKSDILFCASVNNAEKEEPMAMEGEILGSAVAAKTDNRAVPLS